MCVSLSLHPSPCDQNAVVVFSLLLELYQLSTFALQQLAPAAPAVSLMVSNATQSGATLSLSLVLPSQSPLMFFVCLSTFLSLRLSVYLRAFVSVSRSLSVFLTHLRPFFRTSVFTNTTVASPPAPSSSSWGSTIALVISSVYLDFTRLNPTTVFTIQVRLCCLPISPCLFLHNAPHSCRSHVHILSFSLQSWIAIGLVALLMTLCVVQARPHLQCCVAFSFLSECFMHDLLWALVAPVRCSSFADLDRTSRLWLVA